MARAPKTPVAVGDRIGRWTILERAQTRRPGRSYWLCRCDCGTVREVLDSGLRNRETLSCGCRQREIARQVHLKHGHAGPGGASPEYSAWSGMIDRCTRKTKATFKHYGGRGIKVCGRWRKSFEAFLADMGPKPGPEYSLERRDVNGHYEPDNCYWATMTVQARNRRNNRNLTLNDRTMTLRDWASEVGLPESAIRARLKRGWSVEEALRTPLGTMLRTGMPRPNRRKRK